MTFPYDEDVDWTDAYVWAEKARDAGLGITTHVGEVNSANVEAALGLPGVSPVGHAVYAANDPGLLEQMAEVGVAVECCLTSNVVFGVVPSLEQHPIRRMVEAGVPVTLASDDPVRICTSIGREYELAATLGFGPDELLSFTRQAINASFTSPARKARLNRLIEAAAPNAD